VESGGGVVLVGGDEDRLRQVLGNVVGNALVHTAADVPIDVRVSVRGGEVSIEVEDHGQGMDPELARRVTERFFRADPARSRHRGGSGLGLAIADAAVAAHGGSLHVESRPGLGTTVRITLPRAPVQPTREAPEALPALPVGPGRLTRSTASSRGRNRPVLGQLLAGGRADDVS
jgi:two-component system OmpR family sensor kinase